MRPQRQATIQKEVGLLLSNSTWQDSGECVAGLQGKAYETCRAIEKINDVNNKRTQKPTRLFDVPRLYSF